MSDKCCHCSCRISSLAKKYLMAITGLVLAGFAAFHMIGNLQMFSAPEHINAYAHFLQHLPPVTLWGFRGFMLLCVVVHLWTGISLAVENRVARPEKYEVKSARAATLAAKTMPATGVILLVFIGLHIVHYTVKVAFLSYDSYKFALPADMNEKIFGLLYNPIAAGTPSHDVYNMVVDGFSVTWVSVFYIVAMICLFTHLSHGCHSFFQSIGVRNEKWRGMLAGLAKLYAFVVLVGFIAVPACVLGGVIKNKPTASPRGQEVPAAVCAGNTCAAPATTPAAK